MISLITLGIVVVVVIYFSYKFSRKAHPLVQGLKGLPYEKGLPIIGIFYQVQNPFYWYLARLSKKHGALFKIKLGMRDIVILSNYDIIRKALKDDGDNFSGRLKLQMINDITHGSGIIFKDGEVWSKQRSFVLTVLRDFGLGKSNSTEMVQSECKFLLEEIEKEEGKSLDFSSLILYYTGNIISKFIMNKRFSKGDKRIIMIDRLIHEVFKKQDYAGLFFMMFPSSDSSELLLKLIKIFTDRWKRFDEVYDIFRSEIKEHSNRLDFNSEGEDLIDRFLLKQQEMKRKTGMVDTFTDWQLIRNSFELFAGGYETTSTTLEWSCLFLSRHPEIQNKIYFEIIDKIGKDRMVTMNDKVNLHYTQAVMDEIHRMSSILPLSIPHRTFADSSLDGYFIQKDSVIFTNLLACHYDPTIWDNPMKFNPERFLSVNSDGMRIYTPRRELIPFGIGKRQCPGESLARMEYFIFFTSIFQKFQVYFSEEISDKRFEEALLGNEGVVRHSNIKSFIFKLRSTK